MLKRTITGGVILLMTFLFVMLKQISPIFFDAYVLIIMYGSLYEMFKVHQLANKQADFITLCLVPVISCAIMNWSDNFYKSLIFVALLAIAVLVVVLLEEIFEFANDRRYGTTEKNVSVLNQRLFNKTKNTMMVFAYPLLPLLFLMALNHMIYDLAYVGIITAFAVSMLTDTCAYFVGRLFGKRKFIPEVSPNKTVAGMVGGFVGGIIGAIACFFLFYHTSTFAIETFANKGTLISLFIIIGVIGSLINQLGDLVASAYKRKNNIKDFSNIFPGHGGFMDRVDGLMFVASFIYVLFIIFLV
ncbi:MAG: phosphatidate cytidylyltransferase [Clostridia bacterium]|nr:phosphatidate cytidylyltransferase [Clostridia bacterium]